MPSTLYRTKRFLKRRKKTAILQKICVFTPYDYSNGGSGTGLSGSRSLTCMHHRKWAGIPIPIGLPELNQRSQQENPAPIANMWPSYIITPTREFTLALNPLVLETHPSCNIFRIAKLRLRPVAFTSFATQSLKESAPNFVWFNREKTLMMAMMMMRWWR